MKNAENYVPRKFSAIRYHTHLVAFAIATGFSSLIIEMGGGGGG